MLRQEKVMIVIASLTTLLSIVSVNGFKAKSFKHPMKAGEFVQDSQFLTSPGQVYGSCFEKRTHGSKFQAHCTFGLETVKSIGSPDHQRFCHFILHLDNVDQKYEYHASSVVAIDENKAVLTMENAKSSKFFVLHFSDCRAVPVKMDVEVKKAIVDAPYNDFFDIIITDSDDFCTAYAPCRTVVNTEGKVIKKTKKWFEKLDNFVAVVHSPNLGQLVIDESINSHGNPVARIYAVDDHGSIEDLWKQPLHRLHHTINYNRLIVSTTNNRLTVCSVLHEALTCGQFDLDGKKIFEKTLPIHRHLGVRSLNIYNLPNGGFLLVVSECSKTGCSEAKNSFTVHKIDKSGRDFGEFKCMKPNRVDPKLLHFFNNKEDGMCLSFAMQGNEIAELDVICFHDNDFM